MYRINIWTLRSDEMPCWGSNLTKVARELVVAPPFRRLVDTLFFLSSTPTTPPAYT